MRRSIFLTIFVIIYITIFIQIHNYAVEINKRNEAGTFEIVNENQDFDIIFLNQYINSVLHKQYEDGFNMLDEKTKNIFNNNLQEYSDKIKYINETINKYMIDKTTTDIELVEETNLNGISAKKYNIFSTLWTYLKISDLNYYKKYNWFKNLELVEYLPKKYKISFTEIEKEGTEWNIEK